MRNTPAGSLFLISSWPGRGDLPSQWFRQEEQEFGLLTRSLPYHHHHKPNCQVFEWEIPFLSLWGNTGSAPGLCSRALLDEHLAAEQSYFCA